MEYAIAIFVGLWIATAGLLAYRQITKDYVNINNTKENAEE